MSKYAVFLLSMAEINLFYAVLCFKKCLPQISLKKCNKNKRLEKTKKYIPEIHNRAMKIHREINFDTVSFFQTIIARECHKEYLDPEMSIFGALFTELEQNIVTDFSHKLA